MTTNEQAEALADQIEAWVAEWEFAMSSHRGMPGDPGPLADFLAAKLAPWLAGERHRVAAETLREAADEYEDHVDKGGDEHVWWVKNEPRQWLRARADKIERSAVGGSTPAVDGEEGDGPKCSNCGGSLLHPPAGGACEPAAVSDSLPLDPNPWVWQDSVYGNTHRTEKPPTMPVEWAEFMPQEPFEQDAAKYPEDVRPDLPLDPEPYVSTVGNGAGTRHDAASTRRNYDIFDPQPGFSRDESRYREGASDAR